MTMKSVLRVITVRKEPFIYFVKSKLAYAGMLVDLLNELSRRLNFSYIISDEPEGNYGYQDDNGNWDGIIQALLSNKSDVGLATISLTSEHEKVVDLTDSIYPPTGISVLIQKPEVRTEFWRFFTMLNNKVWLCILASYLFASTVIWIFDKYSPYSYRNKKKAEEEKAQELELRLTENADDEIQRLGGDNEPKLSDDDKAHRRIFGIKESLWFLLTSLSPQGGGVAPMNYSGKLVSTTWWLFGFIIASSYTANLAAYYTIARFDRSIETFEDLLKHHRYTYTAIRNTDPSWYFERRKDIEYKLYEAWKALVFNDKLSPYERSQLSVWEYPLSDKYSKINKAMKYQHIKTLDEGLAMFTEKHTKFALIAETTDVEFQVMINCSFKALGPEFAKRPYAIALPKDSPLTVPFNQVIRDLSNDGWFKKMYKKWWTDNRKRVSCYDMNEKKVGILIENIGGLFMIILMGIAAAFVVMLGEYVYLKTNLKRRVIFVKSKKTRKMRTKQDDNDEQVPPFPYTP